MIRVDPGTVVVVSDLTCPWPTSPCTGCTGPAAGRAWGAGWHSCTAPSRSS